MQWQTILTVISPTQPLEALSIPAALVQKLDAHLSVLVAGVTPTPSSTSYSMVAAELWAGEAQKSQAMAKAQAERVEDWLASQGQKGDVAWEVYDEHAIPELIAHRARYSDLVLVGPGAGEPGLQRNALDGALFHSARPVLLNATPETNLTSFGTVILGWDGGMESAKAARVSLSLLQAAKMVHVVLVDPHPSDFGIGPEPGAEIAKYLVRHGVEVTVDLLPDEGRTVAEVLNQHAREIGADLIAMGGYGHSRLRERILGGTTQDMVENSTTPLFMVH